MKKMLSGILILVVAAGISVADENAVINLDAGGNILLLKDKRGLKAILPLAKYDCVQVKLSREGIMFDGEEFEEAKLSERLNEYAILSHYAQDIAFVNIVAAPRTPKKLFDRVVDLVQKLEKPVRLVYDPDVQTQAEWNHYLRTSEGQSNLFRQKNRELLKAFGGALKDAESATLYSLKSKPEKNSKRSKFHGYSILGETSLESGERFSRFRKRMIDSAKPARKETTLCFDPRHGVILHNADGTRLEFLICFECVKVDKWGLSKDLAKALGSFGNDLRDELNALLDARGIAREKVEE